jgi:hypothetical protein
MRIRPTHSAIKSGPHEIDARHMKSWVVESFAGNKWVTLDRGIHDDHPWISQMQQGRSG